MRKISAAAVPLLLSLVFLGCPKPQGYDFRLTPVELRVIRALEPGQTASKTFTFTPDPNLVEDCCEDENDCCCTCQCDPLPCVCTCTDEIIVRGGGPDISQGPGALPLDRTATASATQAAGAICVTARKSPTSPRR